MELPEAMDLIKRRAGGEVVPVMEALSIVVRDLVAKDESRSIWAQSFASYLDPGNPANGAVTPSAEMAELRRIGEGGR